MRTIHLSTYLQDRLFGFAAERADRDAAALQCYESQLAIRQAKLKETRSRIQAAWQLRKPVSFVAATCRLIGLVLTARPAAPKRTEPSERELIFRAGLEGEHRVMTHFSRELDDSWTALTGYKAGRGDVDMLLVGPNGLLAIEIKHLNASVFCDGDSWYRVRNGRREDLVSGRHVSPSLQLNESLAPLRNYLSQRCGLQDIRTVVLLSHKRSQILRARRCTVDHVLTLNNLDVRAWLTTLPAPASHYDCSTIVAAIRKSHRHWNSSSNASAVLASERMPGIESDTATSHAVDPKRISSSSVHMHDGGFDLHGFPSRSKMSFENQAIWMAGAFDKFTDKPALLRRRKK